MNVLYSLSAACFIAWLFIVWLFEYTAIVHVLLAIAIIGVVLKAIHEAPTRYTDHD